MIKRFAVIMLGALLASLLNVGTVPGNSAASAAALTGTSMSFASAHPDKNKPCEEKKGFPPDCGATMGISTPGFKQYGSFSEFGMNVFYCESPQLIYKLGLGKFCYPQQSPFGICKQASATFWYVEAGYKARTLDGYGGVYIVWDSPDFPISFTSPTLIVPGNKYGLCILADGNLMQDDFAAGTAVSPNGDTANMLMVLQTQYVSFYYSEGFSIYLEAGPGSNTHSAHNTRSTNVRR